MPGAIRASASIHTTGRDVAWLLAAVARVANSPPPIEYRQDPASGDCHPLRQRPRGAAAAEAALGSLPARLVMLNAPAKYPYWYLP
jgi:hypothetical protein